jgi:hypothetical protein
MQAERSRQGKAQSFPLRQAISILGFREELAPVTKINIRMRVIISLIAWHSVPRCLFVFFKIRRAP